MRNSAEIIRRLVVTVAGVLALGPAARGYVFFEDEGGYVFSWAPGSIPLRVMLPTSPTLSDGTTFSSSVVGAMQAWNAVLGTVQLTGDVQAPGPYVLRNGVSEIALDSTVGGQAFSANTVAVTVLNGSANAITDTDIIFNSARTWDSYRGSPRPQVDIRRVAIHELGHVLGLDHPFEQGQSVISIMNYDSTIEAVTSDDIAGIQTLYGAPGFVPANDNFANAAVIAPAASTQIAATNVASTAEPGEPNHDPDNEPSGRSVWWRWTAPSNGTITITTLGSIFDTLLAVYTGSSVSALTPIVKNDDEEPAVPGESNPQRKRTSRVVFEAVAGTTYHIAVDGWDGYAGSISMAITFSGAIPTAPVFTTHPVGQTVPPGSSVTFTAVANGVPSPVYQWKKNGVNIGGATGSSYTISSVSAGDTGTYTLTATNSAGSTTSNGATLALTTIPAGFDVQSYLSRYPDVAALYGSDHYGAWLYYRDHGIYDGEVYDELFRVEEYLILYPELFAIFGNNLTAALEHWLSTGRIEGKLGRIPLEFNAEGYFSRNPDVAAAVGFNHLLAWQHFWLYGIYEGRAYDDELRVFEYLALNPDLQAAFLEDWRGGTLHWMRYGRTEGRLGRVPVVFDVNYYLTQYPDVEDVFGTYQSTVFQHYWYFGVYEARIFDNEFRVDEYLSANPDLLAIIGTDRRAGFMHWVRYGRAEGRPGRNP